MRTHHQLASTKLGRKSRTARQQLKRSLRFEAMEPRHLMAVVLWDGEAGDDLWHTAANWQGNVVPTSNDDVVIDVAGVVKSIVIESTSVVVRSINSQEKLIVRGSAGLTFAAATTGPSSTLDSGIEVSFGRLLRATGVNTSVTINGGSTIDGANLQVDAGASLSLPGVTSFTSTGSSPFNDWTVQGSGSLLDLQNVTTIVGSSTNDRNLRLTASSGGRLDLRRVTTFTDPETGDQRGRAFRISATGVGSEIDLSALTTINDRSQASFAREGFSLLSASNSAQILVPNLASLTNTELVFSSPIAVPSLTNFTLGSIRVVGVNVSLPTLTNVDGFQLNISGGGSLSLPNVTSYTNTSPSAFNDWTVQGSGSLLDLQNITMIVGSSTLDKNFRLTASSGGRVDLRSVTTLTDPESGDLRGRAFRISATGAGSEVDLSALTTIIDRSQANFARDGFSLLSASSSAQILVPNLISLSHTELVFSSPIAVPLLTNFTLGSISVVGVNVSLPTLTNVDGVQLNISGGGSLALPNVTSYTNTSPSTINDWSVQGSGSLLDLQNITTIVGGSDIDRHLRMTANSGGRVDLRRVTTFTDPETGDLRGRAFRVSATGAGSEVDLSALTSIIDRTQANWGREGFSLLSASSNGQILVPNLASLSHTELVFSSPMALPLLTNFTLGSIRVVGVSVSLPTLTNVDGFQLNISGGGSLALPSVTSYTNTSPSTFNDWTVQGSGSLLDLQNITTIVGGSDIDRHLLMTASGGGRLDLRRVTTFIDPETGDLRGRAFRVSATGAGSEVDLSALTTIIDRTQANWGREGFSLLSASSSGQILVPNLASLSHTELIFSSPMALPLLTNFTLGSIRVVGVGVSLPLLTNVDGFQLNISGGGSLSLPNVTSYTNTSPSTFNDWTVQGSGSLLDLQNITTIVGGSDIDRHLLMTASGGGRLDLRRVTTFTDPETGDLRGRAFRVSATGAGSEVDLSALTTIIDRTQANWGREGFSLLSASSSGQILVPNLTSLSNTELAFSSPMTLPLLANFTLGSIRVVGVSVSLPLLTNVDGFQLNISGGGSLSLPSVTSYTNTSPSTFNDWTVQGSGSLLDLQNITTIVGSSAIDRHLLMTASSGGRLDLRRVTTLTDPETGDLRGRAFRVSATGAGSEVDLSALTTIIDRSQADWGREGLSLLSATAGAQILAAALQVVTNVNVRVVANTSIVTASNLELGVNSSLEGTGTLQGNVVNASGVIKPGDGNVGLLTISGNYTQLPGGSIVFELAGPVAGVTHDQLLVGGALSLNGTLRLERLNGYAPTIGTAMAIIANAASRTGQFSILEGLSLPNSREFAPLYSNNGVTITTEAASPPFIIGLAPDSPIPAPVSSIDVLFSKPIDPTSFTTTDASLSGPNGPVSIHSIVRLSDVAFRATFDPLLVGTFTLSIGPNIFDFNSAAMDQNRNGTTGEPTDVFTGQFQIAPDLVPPRVLNASPFGLINTPFSGWQVEFSEAILAGSFTVDDVTVLTPAGTLASSTITLTPSATNNRLFMVAIPTQTLDGAYLLTLATDIRDLSSNQMVAPYATNVILDTLGPRVQSISTTGTLNDPIDHINVTFNERLSSFTSADVQLVTPTGVVVTGNPQWVGGLTYRIPFAQQRSNGQYTLRIGPGARDAAGNDMNVGAGGGVAIFNFSVSLADFTIANDTLTVVPSSTTFGTPLTLNWRLHNAGLLSSTSTWSDQIWLSANSQLDASDRLLSTVSQSLSGGLASANSQDFSASVTVPIDAGLAAGNYFIIVQTDASNLMVESNETNNTQAAPLSLTYPPLPDLVVVADSIHGPISLASGTQFDLQWSIDNIGTATASGSWIEKVYLASSPTSNDRQLIGQFNHSGNLTVADSALARSVTLTVPELGIGGALYYIVEVDAARELFELDENNALASAQTTDVPLQMSLDLSDAELSEGGSAIEVTLTRNGSTGQALTVSLATDVADQLNFPSQVIIPAGQYTTRFNVTAINDAVVESVRELLLTATATAYPAVSKEIVLLDNDLAMLTLTLTPASSVEGSIVVGRVTRNQFNDQALDVALVADRGQLTLPITVTIPANQAFVDFNLNVLNDTLVEATTAFPIVAAAPDLVSSTVLLSVPENDVPTLTLALPATQLPEGSSGPTIQGTVTRTIATDREQIVSLLSSNSNLLIAASTVTIPAGATTVTFAFSLSDDALVNSGDRIVSLTARPVSSDGLTVFTSSNSAQTITVLDNDGPTLSLVVSPAVVAEGSTAQLTVRRNTSTSGPLTVTLLSNAPDQLQVPESVVIPDGSATVDVSIQGINDRIVDGDTSVTVTAQSSGFASAVVPLVVTDSDLPDLFMPSITGSATAETGQLIDVTAVLTNIGLSSAFGTMTQRVFFSSDAQVGSDVLAGQFDFIGPLLVNQSYNRTLSLRAPSVPGQYWLIVQADAGNTVHEGLETNNATVSSLPITIAPAYTASVSTTVDSAPSNTAVPLQGFARKTDDSPAPFEQVSIQVNVRGTTRTLTVLTDANGNFSTVFRPLPGEGGVYTIGAAHPGVANAPVQDTFRLLGMKATLGSDSISIVEGGSTSAQIDITNLADISQTGLQIELVSAPSNLTVSAGVVGNSTTLPSGGTLSIQYNVAANDSSIILGQVQLRISTDQSRAGNAADLFIDLNTTVIPLTAKLELDRSLLSTSMLVGDQTTVEFTVTNNGGIESGPLTLEIPASATWLVPTGGVSIPSIAAGDSTTISLLLQPAASLPLTVYNGAMVLRGEAAALEIPFSFRAVSSSKGELQLSVVDELFFFTEAKPLVTDSVVVLRDPFTREEILRSNPAGSGGSGEGDDRPGVSVDAQGRIKFVNLPAGPYEIEVISEDHDPHVEVMDVTAGVLTTDQVFVTRNFVRYNWTVEEVEVEDRTRVIIESVFETNVPAPVVTVDGVIDLAQMITVGQTKQFDLKITNHGLIAALDVALQFGSHPDFRITPLIDTIGTLAAKTEVIVPVMVTRIAGGSGSLIAEGEDPAPCAIAAVVVYSYICEDRVLKAIPIGVVNVNVYCTPANVRYIPVDGSSPAVATRLIPVSISTGPMCDCVEVTLFQMDVSEYLEPPVKIAEAALNAYLATTGLSAELDVTATAQVSTCCDTPTGIGIKFSTEAEVSATITAGPKLPVPKLSSSFKAPDGADVTVSGSLFVGLQAYITAAIGGSIASACDWSDIEASLNGSLTVGFRGGIEGKLSFSKANGLFPITIEQQAVGLVAGEVTGSINYSTANGLQYCLDSQGVYIEVAFNVFNVQWSPFDDPNTPAFETKYYFIQPARVCSPSGQGRSFEVENNSFTKTLQEKLGVHKGQASIDVAPFTTPAAAEGGVCAQVRLQITQDAVLTRTAFRASLELDNVGVTSAVENLNIDIAIYDTNGLLVNNLFTVLTPDLKVIDKVDGTGTLAANRKGSATWMIFANREAAPTTAMTYTVGGVMRYTQNGERIVIPMARVPITVLPDAELQLDYFLQRDVLGDDPFTEQVEPSQLFSLAVMVKNEGAGIAKALQLESAQPRIIENEKGLLIDFEIVSSAVNGQPAERNLVAQMGNIGPGKLAFAEWQLLSTLQGLFVEYDARFEHVSDLGDNRLSLIKRVDIHELIRVVDDRQTGRVDMLPDFLVNDLPDANDLPDTLYLSDGTRASVSQGFNPLADGVPQISDLQVGVTASMPAGWSYLTMNDPSAGAFRLVGVRRSDGTNLPLKNFWQTDRTFVGQSQRPVLEDKIHLLDLDSTGSYTFIFSNGDLAGPSITTLGATISNPAQDAVNTADVTFSESIDLATLDWQDLSLRKNGTPVTLNAGVTITNVNDVNYLISGLSGFTSDDGVYELTLSGASVLDQVGNPGTNSLAVTWAKGQSAPAIVEILGVPQGVSNQSPTYFDIVFTEPIDLNTLTHQDIVLQRNDTPLNLTGSSFTLVSDHVVRVGNIGSLLLPDGSYRLTVNANGIQDLDAALAGIGSRTAAWILDQTAPVVVDVIDITSDPRNTVVQRIDVEFSELIDLATFDVADVTLTRDAGTTNLLAGDARVSIEHLFGHVYRLSGINWVQGFLANPQVAQFTFSVIGTGIRDLAGNTAVGSASEPWTIDLDRPQQLTNVVLTSQGSPVVSGVLPSVLAEVSGNTAEPGLTIAIRDMTSDTELARQTLTDQTFSIPIRFPSPGNHQLRVRQIDAAGNTTDLLIDDLFVRDTPPVIESVVGLPTGNTQFSSNSITVSFVSNIDMSTFSVADLRLTRNGGANLLTSSVTITPQPNGRSVVIGNLQEFNSVDGVYEFTLELSAIASTLGILGSGQYVQSWKLDRAAPTSAIAALSTTQGLPTFAIQVSGTDPQLAAGVPGSGISHYELQVSTDGGPFTLWRTVPADQPSVDYNGRPARTYAFRSIAVDQAGNTGIPSASTTTSVPDLVAPITEVGSLDTSKSRVVVSVSGTDAGNDLQFFDVYVSIDGGDPSLIARVPAGTPNAQGTYSASLYYFALTDGLPHNYRIFTRGVDGSLNMEEAPGETKGLSFSATYVAYAQLIGDPVFGDGTEQRSNIDRLVLTFDGPVEIQSGALMLTRRSNGEQVPTSASTTTNGQGQFIVTLTFSGPNTRAGALVDGYYQLAIDGTKILRNGRGLDIDGDGLGGDARTIGASEADKVFALYGDTSGDGLVSVTEFGQFRSAFGKTVGQAGYDVNFDFERDGAVGVSDFGQFRSRFGKPKLAF